MNMHSIHDLASVYIAINQFSGNASFIPTVNTG